MGGQATGAHSPRRANDPHTQGPGGEPLDLVLERNQGQPLDLAGFLRMAIGLATALGQVHRHGLIHKDLKPANVLVDSAGNVWLTGSGLRPNFRASVRHRRRRR
jgi:serine/threonine protein kinase